MTALILGAVAERVICTETNGFKQTAQFLKDGMSTIKTAIQQTMNWITSSCLKVGSITSSIHASAQKSSVQLQGNTSIASDTWLAPGIDRRKGKRGTQSTGSAHGTIEKHRPVSAKSVTTLTKRDIKAKQDSVVTNARQHGAVKRGLMMRPGHAPIANQSFELVDTLLHGFALEPVALQDVSKETRSQIVYNLTVEERAEYFANGILVHNCMDAARYGLFTHFQSGISLDVNPDAVNEAWNKARGMNQELPRFFQEHYDAHSQMRAGGW